MCRLRPLVVVSSALAVALLLSACSAFVSPGSKVEPSPIPAPAITDSKRPAPTEAPKPRRVEHPRQLAPPAPPKRIALVYPTNVPAYASLAKALVAHFGDKARPVALSGDRELGLESQVEGYSQVVAVGERAARAAKDLHGKQLIFCDVFNFRDIGLPGHYLRGVSDVPPAKNVFSAWKKLTPNLKRVGLIIGPGHEDLINAANKAAQQLQLQLVSRVSHSDQATLFVFKRLVPQIDGFWLLQDNRILSHRALRELMAYSKQHKIPVVAFSSEFLNLGAIMTASASEEDVVKQVSEAIDQLSAKREISGFRLLPLTEVRLEINPDQAQRDENSRTPFPKQSAAHVKQ